MMKRFIRVAKLLVLLCVVTVLLSTLSLKTTEAKATTSKVSQNRYSSTSCQWSVVPSPNGSSSSGLSAVAAVSANDVWDVGSYHNSNSNTFFQTLTEQWNGTKWSVVKSPSPGSFSTQLLGVATVSATNVWAVGGADSNTLTEHFHC